MLEASGFGACFGRDDERPERPERPERGMAASGGGSHQRTRFRRVFVKPRSSRSVPNW